MEEQHAFVNGRVEVQTDIGLLLLKTRMLSSMAGRKFKLLSVLVCANLTPITSGLKGRLPEFRHRKRLALDRHFYNKARTLTTKAQLSIATTKLNTQRIFLQNSDCFPVDPPIERSGILEIFR